jgi:hypothetical protein
MSQAVTETSLLLYSAGFSPSAFPLLVLKGFPALCSGSHFPLTVDR